MLGRSKRSRGNEKSCKVAVLRKKESRIVCKRGTRGDLDVFQGKSKEMKGRSGSFWKYKGVGLAIHSLYFNGHHVVILNYSSKYVAEIC